MARIAAEQFVNALGARAHIIWQLREHLAERPEVTDLTREALQAAESPPTMLLERVMRQRSHASGALLLLERFVKEDLDVGLVWQPPPEGEFLRHFEVRAWLRF